VTTFPSDGKKEKAARCGLFLFETMRSIWKKDGVYGTSQRVKKGVKDCELRFATAAAGGGYNAVLVNRFLRCSSLFVEDLLAS
jgi:hypothetical protein